MDILKEIEEFYEGLERISNDYKRPVDYIERYIRVIARNYNPAHLEAAFKLIGGEKHGSGQ